jgi:DNA-binding MltR family transcriptional regulator
MSAPQTDLLQTSLDAQIVILCAAHLDKTLRMLLEWRAKGASKKLKDDLFDGNGPIATFSAKISVSYAFGFITQDDYKNLGLVRKVRNAFAHSDDFVNFETPGIRKLMGAPGKPGKDIFTNASDAAMRGLQKQLDDAILASLHGAKGPGGDMQAYYQGLIDARDKV